MNAITMYQNALAEENAQDMSKMDTTQPLVDPYRPEASETVAGTSRGEMLANTSYHFIFVLFFLFVGLILLGHLTGELTIK